MTVSFRRYEIIWGIIYTLAELFILPIVVGFIAFFMDLPMWMANCILFTLNALFLCIIFHRYLWSNLKIALGKPLSTLGYCILGFVLYFASNIMTSLITYSLLPDYVNLNDETVGSMVIDGGLWMILSTVLLAPIGEELLFRGLLFRGIYDRSPWAAWIISSAAFSIAHIVGYIGSYEPMALLISFIQYLPAGLCLAFSYYQSGSIITPILIHILINSISILLL